MATKKKKHELKDDENDEFDKAIQSYLNYLVEKEEKNGDKDKV
jgi:trimethylamine:corrinoid methyltransferase-like protein